KTFSFANRDLGQHVHLSDIYAAIHNVKGVAYCDVDAFAAISADDDRLSEIIGDETKSIADTFNLRAPPLVRLTAEPSDLICLSSSSSDALILSLIDPALSANGGQL